MRRACAFEFVLAVSGAVETAAQSPEAGRKQNVEHAICNCIAFGSKNSALVLRRLT